jgi:hypothetical protein
MRLKCLCCEAFARPIYLYAAQSPHIVDVELFRIGLHTHPVDLRQQLQSAINAVPADAGYDAVVLAYGLCGKATAGLTAKNAPLVLPRAHDCITLFLGSRERYTREFNRCPGTYWYALDYVERRDGTGTALSLGAGVDTDAPSVYEEYVEKYGRSNADYLMEVMGAWKEHYQRAAFIDLGVGDSTHVETQARDEAERRGWTFERYEGDLVLLRRLLMGDWESDFLVLQPDQQVAMTHNDDVLGAI